MNPLANPVLRLYHMSAERLWIRLHETANLFIQNISRLHAFPNTIFKLTPKFWKHVFKTLKTQLRLSTFFHPETDGQTERLNRTIQISLRHYLIQNHSIWANYLPLAEFTYDSSKHRSIDKTPFSLLNGRDLANSRDAVISEIVDHSSAASSSSLTAMQDCWGDAQDVLSYARAQYAKLSNTARASTR